MAVSPRLHSVYLILHIKQKITKLATHNCIVDLLKSVTFNSLVIGLLGLNPSSSFVTMDGSSVAGFFSFVSATKMKIKYT